MLSPTLKSGGGDAFPRPPPIDARAHGYIAHGQMRVRVYVVEGGDVQRRRGEGNSRGGGDRERGESVVCIYLVSLNRLPLEYVTSRRK